MAARAKQAPSSRSTAVLEVTPRAAKLVVASSLDPLQIERVNAATLTDSGDALTALKALLEQPSGVRDAGILFGREVFSLQTLELPAVDPKEIGSMLELQLGKLTPYPRSEILFSYMPVGSFREGYTTVLLAVSRKALIEEVLAFCGAKGIRPRWVGVSSEGLESWWRGKNPPAASAGQLTVVVDVDFASTDCAVLSPQQKLLFTYSIPLGSEQIAASEQARLRWLGELVRLPRILVHQEVKGAIARGVITGATGGIDRIAEQLVSQWGASVETMDAFPPGVPESVRAKALVSRASYTALLGCLQAGRAPQIDLIPQQMRVSEALHTRSKHLERVVVNLIAVLCLAMLFYAQRIILLQRYHGQLASRLAPLEVTARDIQKKQELMQDIRRWLDPQRSALGVIQAVAASVDGSVTVTQMSYKQGEPVKIRGIAGSSQAPYQMVERLKKQRTVAVGSPCLAEVRVSGARGADFDITCALAGS